MRIQHEYVLPQAAQPGSNIVAAASSCPVLACGSLVVDYKPADSVRPSHPEDWEFTCSRCGMEFMVTQGELIFQSVSEAMALGGCPRGVGPQALPWTTLIRVC
jgi:hypothetical protein